MSIAETILLQGFTAQLAISGETVTYRTNGVAPGTAITAIVERQIPEVIDLHGIRAERSWTLRVLSADVAAPTEADTVVIGSESFRLASGGIEQGGHWELPIVAIDQVESSREGYRR